MDVASSSRDTAQSSDGWKTASELIADAQALLDKGPQNAGPAVLRLKAAAETAETVDLLLLLVRACILESLLEGDDEVLTAVEKAKRAVELSQKESSEVQSLALLHLGVAQSQAADQMDLLPRKLKVQYDKEALEALQKAAQLQPDSFLCLYNLARIQARARDVEGALKNARRALSLAPPGEGPLMWALLALLLTARKEGQVAFSVIEAGLLQVGLREQLLLLRIKAKLHQLQGAPEVGLEALAKAQARAPSDDSDLWLHIGEAFLVTKSVADAAACREQAVQIGGFRSPVLLLDAHIHQVKGEWKEALLCCQDALAVKPTNADVLFRMGMLYKERNLSMDDKWFAIGLFSDAALYRPTMEEAWRQKGLIYQGLEMERDAKETLYEADRLLETQPALPFGEIPYCL